MLKRHRRVLPQDWDGAADLYDKACKLCKGSSQVPEVGTVLLACLTNRALTLLKLDRHKDVVTTCSEALLLDPVNEKALYRRGVARSKMGLVDDAEGDLKRVLSLDPKNSDAKKALQECQRLRKRGVGQASKVRPFEGMFNRSSPEKPLENRFAALSCEESNGEGGGARVCPYGGLKNEGATCYLNSVLQTIFHLAIFRRAIYSIPTSPARAGEKVSVALALQRLFCRLQSPAARSKAVSGVELLASFGWDSNDMLMQQDVGEFVNVFFDRIEEHMKRDTAVTNSSMIDFLDLFGVKESWIDTIAKPASAEEKEWVRFRDQVHTSNTLGTLASETRSFF
jgi:tetratricopeptide (TPR) repeat protein